MSYQKSLLISKNILESFTKRLIINTNKIKQRSKQKIHSKQPVISSKLQNAQPVKPSSQRES